MVRFTVYLSGFESSLKEFYSIEIERELSELM